MCGLSLICTFFLSSLHSHVIEKDQEGTNSDNKKPNEKKDEMKKENTKSGLEIITYEIRFVYFIFIMCYASLHAFYPNFSKFLQQNYGYTNEEAGHLSSIPYLLSSIFVPLFGHGMSFVSEKSYTIFLIIGMVMIWGAHAIFLVILEEDMSKDGHLNQVWIILIPIIMITLAHSIFSTL
jgi:nitrate/nitrite transporter NarK